jgi:hypothetical protein
MTSLIRTVTLGGLVVVASITTGCLDVAPIDGRYGCRSADDCPAGWVCAVPEMRCRARASDADAASRDAGPTTSDASFDGGRDASIAHDAGADDTGDAASDDAGTDAAISPDAGTDACTPDVAATCAGRCGNIVDARCGQLVDCGDPCVGSDSCGGGGTPGVCGCTPSGDPCAGVVCGMELDSCGNGVLCNTCSVIHPVCHPECGMCLVSGAECP